MANTGGSFHDAVYIEDLGDNLFRIGYDIFSTYPIESHKTEKDKVTYTFKKSANDSTTAYTVVVSWTLDEATQTKTNVKWERKY